MHLNASNLWHRFKCELELNFDALLGSLWAQRGRARARARERARELQIPNLNLVALEP